MYAAFGIFQILEIAGHYTDLKSCIDWHNEPSFNLFKTGDKFLKMPTNQL